MEGRSQHDIPLIVWSWQGEQVVLVFGRHALNALCEASTKFMPQAIELRSHSKKFETLTFRKTKQRAERAGFGGIPVLCYDVQSSTLPSKDVVTLLLNRFRELGTFPTVWIFNPYIQYEAQHGINLYCVKEDDTAFNVLEPLFGKRKHEEMAHIMQKTNVLALEPFSPWLIGDDEEEDDFLF